MSTKVVGGIFLLVLGLFTRNVFMYLLDSKEK
jgi:hypothetical protein